MHTDTPAPVNIAPVRWFGGKGNLKKWVLPHIPYTQTYVDAFGGAGSIFFARNPSPVEVYNDLNGDLANLMRVLRDNGKWQKLEMLCNLTLYSRAEFVAALDLLHSGGGTDIERAHAFFVAQNQGFGGKLSFTGGDWGRAVTESTGGIAATVARWQTRLNRVGDWHARIANAQIDNRDALDVIQGYDSPETTFYLDPPYVMGTRKGDGDYAHEMADSQHSALVDLLLTAKGSVTLSGYDNPIYAPLVDAGWTIVSRRVGLSCGNTRQIAQRGKRTECLWLNPRCQQLLARGKGTAQNLF